MKKFIGDDVLQAFVTLTPYINDMLALDFFVAVTDMEKYIAYEAGYTIDIGLKVNDQIKEGSSAHKALKSRNREIVNVPREVYGVPYKAISEPVFNNNNQIVGSVVVGLSLDNQHKLQEIIQQFNASFQEVNSSIQEISTGSQQLAKTSQILSDKVYQTKQNLYKTTEIMEMIKHVSNQTNLLGLNAAIEAARAGEAGRGFNVVANEIRSLSDKSNVSAKNVGEILQEITNSIESINNETQETSAISQQQAASTEEIAAAMEELIAQIDSLNEFINLL